MGSPSAPTKSPVQDLHSPPTEKIVTMRSSGLTNNQIIQSLQREGYDSDMIFKGMNQADISAGIELHPAVSEEDNWPPLNEPLENPMQFTPGVVKQQTSSMPPPMQKKEFSGMPTFSNQTDQNTTQQRMQQPLPPHLPQHQQGFGDLSGAPPFMQSSPLGSGPSFSSHMSEAEIGRIEEIAEAIIDEKWNEVVKSINKIIDWKDRTENKILQLEQRFNDLRKDFDTLSQGILGKVGEYDKNLTDIGVEIKAMERVFQKVLPSLTENVHALERLTQDLKSTKRGRELLGSDDDDEPKK